MKETESSADAVVSSPWGNWQDKLIALAVFVSATGMWVISFAPVNISEAVYFFAIPIILWFFRNPPRKLALWTSFAIGLVSWIFLVSWLRNCTSSLDFFGKTALGYFLVLILSLYLSLYWFAWCYVGLKVFPRAIQLNFARRFPVLMGMAGLWILLDFLRSWLFTGLPFLPLAASQWNRSAILQLAAYTGAWGVTFVILTVNLSVAVYLHKIIFQRKIREWYLRLCPDFYVAFAFWLGSFLIMFIPGYYQQHRTLKFNALLVQPNVKQPVKWNPEYAGEVLKTLNDLSTYGALSSKQPVDLIIWPESVTPWPVVGNDDMKAWVEDLASNLGKPILMGNMAVKEDNWYNAAFLVDPVDGLKQPYYAKRKLLPFGEYVPLRHWIPFIEKMVPIAGSILPGEDPQTLPLKIAGQTVEIGPMICSEDLFPGLARESVKAYAGLLYVPTNNAWFGEEGGAYQHAAHSVLRAVETRRPLIRCGNNGWSGWIDEYGEVREIMNYSRNDIYYGGSHPITVSFDPRWFGRQSFYTRFGDWFVAVSFLLAFGGWYILRKPENDAGASGSEIAGKDYKPGEFIGRMKSRMKK